MEQGEDVGAQLRVGAAYVQQTSVQGAADLRRHEDSFSD